MKIKDHLTTEQIKQLGKMDKKKTAKRRKGNWIDTMRIDRDCKSGKTKRSYIYCNYYYSLLT